MSFTSPVFPDIPRQPVVGEDAEWVKMLGLPAFSPPTPELITPTNPVPEVMLAAGFQSNITTPHTVQRVLLRSSVIPAYDGKALNYFLMEDSNNPATSGGTFPAATIRVPRGVIFHGAAQGKGPPPHTIHWHGIEPSPINNGIGHCSMETGTCLYQWQPNFIGSYFYHCHRNTMQPFEYGSYGFLIVEPPDAHFASCATDPGPGGAVTLNATPIGNGRPEPGFPLGRRRTAANVANFPQFPGFNSNQIDADDPEAGNRALPAWLKFQTDPHAMTIPYDVEVLWVTDARSSEWSDLAQKRDPTTSIPAPDADYWYVTGVNFPGTKVGKVDNLGNPGTATIAPNIVIPPQLMSGVSGVQISVNTRVNQTILVRCLNGAYNDMAVTFPVDIVIIAWDGRALGVPPYGKYNYPYLVPANTPIQLSAARRFDALIRSSSPINSFAKVEFIENTVGKPSTMASPAIFTGLIPFDIGALP